MRVNRLSITLTTALWRAVSDRRGNVALFFGLGLLPLMIMVGAATDYARLVRIQSNLQTALDAAVMAALPYQAASRKTVGTAYLSAQLPVGLTLTSSDFTTNADGSLTGTAQGTVSTAFMAIANISSMTAGASAKVGYSSSPAKVCLLIKDPSAGSALLMNSGASINAPSCEIDVASTGSPAATLNAPTLNISSLCVKGTSVLQNGATTPSLRTGCSTASDPFVGTLPTVTVSSCTVSNQNYSNVSNLVPGTYCGNFNFNGSGTLALAPGLYVLSGAHWNLNSGWTVQGSGVTFYYADSNSYIQVNSGVTMNVSVPTSGSYANFLMYEPAGLTTSSFTIDGSAGHTLSGLIYLPSRNVTFNAMSSTTSESLTMVFNQLILNQSS